ncbi:MAG: PIN domain-containing protein [Synechococcales bacterium]|nr:PIN domain-containing protein [Synechococcales bacterium]
MIRTFVDSSVLIAAARARTARSLVALSVLNERDREFASSVFVRLETLPKAIYYQQQAEAEFYESFFEDANLWATDLEQIVQTGNRIARNYGLAAMDALHIAAALSVEAEELITTEKSTKPMHRATEIQIVSIFD